MWGLLFNSPDLGWVTVRDLGHDLTYEGWVDAFSDTSASAELLLRDVRVFRSSSGAQLYETSRVYLARPSDTLVIEPAQ